MNGFDTYDELLAAVEETGAPYRTIGYAPGGNPIIGVEAGGEKEPAVFVTAGAHATEHAGVVAAVELIEALDTDHRVAVVPCRDPVGLEGFQYALDLGTDGAAAVGTWDDVEPAIREHGDVIHEDDEVVLATIGDYGYAAGRAEDVGSVDILMAAKEYTETNPGVLDRLRGRRIFTPPGHVDIEATEGLERAYTLIVDPDGLPLHLNRFFTTTWAAPETRAVRRFMDEVEPGLTFDNHETSGHEDRYHISLRPQRTDALDEQEREVALAVTAAVADAGIPLATDEDVLDEPTKTVAHDQDAPDEPFYSRAGDGAYWVDPNLTDPPRLGEGLNATDYAAEHYGLAYTNESGMYGTLEERVTAQVTAVRTAVRELERLHD